MAAANLTYHTPILSIQNRANTAPLTAAIPEAATQSFKNGSLITANAGGFAAIWPNTNWTNTILGVSESFGLNLASNGLGAPGMPFGPIGGTGAIQTYGYVLNEPNAVNIALGTPISDGRTLYVEANLDNVFEAIFDNSTGTVAANYTPTQAMLNTTAGQFGMTLDANGFWYVDGGVTGAHAVVQVIGVNPVDGFIVNARVRFKFLPTAIQVEY
jgi:hypothetical protein